MNKEQLLKYATELREIFEVKFEHLGQQVKINYRRPSLATASRLMSMLTKNSDGTLALTESYEGDSDFIVQFVIGYLYDSDAGKQMFEQSDFSIVKEFDPSLLKKIVEEINNAEQKRQVSTEEIKKP